MRTVRNSGDYLVDLRKKRYWDGDNPVELVDGHPGHLGELMIARPPRQVALGVRNGILVVRHQPVSLDQCAIYRAVSTTLRL